MRLSVSALLLRARTPVTMILSALSLNWNTRGKIKKLDAGKLIIVFTVLWRQRYGSLTCISNHFSCRYVKLPAYYIATDAVFLNLMNELVDSINGMPDAVGLDSWKNGLKNVIDLFEDVVEYVPWIHCSHYCSIKKAVCTLFFAIDRHCAVSVNKRGEHELHCLQPKRRALLHLPLKPG